jgi:ribose transport system permease protein
LIVAAMSQASPLLRLRRLRVAPALVAYLLCGVIWLVAGFFFPGFASAGHLRYMLELAAMLGIVAGGQTAVVVAGGIDLSVGSLIAISAIFGSMLSNTLGGAGIEAITLAVLTTTVLGALNGVGVSLLRIHPLVMTLAMGTILTGTILVVDQGLPVSASGNRAMIWLANGHIAGVTVSIWCWGVVSLLLFAVLNDTVVGKWAYAVGTSVRASELSGVDSHQTLIAVYALSGFTAGLTGILLAGNTMEGYIGIGTPYLLLSVAAVVVGGTSIFGGQGGILGTIAGSILLTTVTSLITIMNVSAGARSIFLGALILGLVTLYAREGRS